jgi:hypothetical protein
LDSQDCPVRNLATALYVHCDRLFTCIEHSGVEPTNNAAERALRIAVQWLKTSFGNRCAQGEIATARLLTVSQTAACRIATCWSIPATPSLVPGAACQIPPRYR